MQLQQTAGNRATVQLLRGERHEPRALPERVPTVQRGVLGFLGGVIKGGASYVADLGRGTKRMVKSWRFWNSDAMIRIANENAAACRILKSIVASPKAYFEEMLGLTIGGLITSESLSPEVRSAAKTKFGDAAESIIANIVAKQIGKTIVNKLTRRLAARAVASGIYKKLARKLAIGAAFKTTGIGAPVFGLGMLGLIEKASAAARRLERKYPSIYRRLKPKDMHMAWFLIEPHVPELNRAALDLVFRTTPEGRVMVDWKREREPIRSGGSGDGRRLIRSKPLEPTRRIIRSGEAEAQAASVGTTAQVVD